MNGLPNLSRASPRNAPARVAKTFGHRSDFTVDAGFLFMLPDFVGATRLARQPVAWLQFEF